LAGAFVLLLAATLGAAAHGSEEEAIAAGEELGRHILNRFDALPSTQFERLPVAMRVRLDMLGPHVFTSYRPPDFAATKAAVDAAFDPAKLAEHPSIRALSERVIDNVLELVGRSARRFDFEMVAEDAKKWSGRKLPGARQDGSLWIISLPSFIDDEDHTCGKSAGLFAIPSSINGVVLDLRGNGGGSLMAIECVAGAFIKDSVPIYFMRTVAVPREVRYPPATNRRPIKLPVVVLIDGETDSGALLIAAILRDLRRAKILGQPRREVHGTLMQSRFLRTADTWEPGSLGIQIVLPFGELIRRNGEPLGSGVAPDVVVSTDDEAALFDAARRALGGHLK
jgi:hypothetical protein